MQQHTGCMEKCNAYLTAKSRTAGKDTGAIVQSQDKVIVRHGQGNKLASGAGHRVCEIVILAAEAKAAWLSNK